jgi:hypothetical protein
MTEWLDAARYDEIELAGKLSVLTPPARTLFVCACAERLMPAYRWFCLVTGSDDHGLVREALNVAWASAAGEAVAELDSLRKRIIDLAPHSDDLQISLGHAVAQNAVACVCYALEVCQTGDVQASVWAARQLYDAADSVVQQGSAAQTYIADIDREEPVRMMLQGIAAALGDVGSSNVADLRAKAADDGEKFLTFLTGEA